MSRVLQIMRELEPAVDDADGLYLIQYENGTHERVTTSDLQILLANGDSRRQARLAYDTDLCQVCLRADYGEGHWAHRVTPPRTLLVVTDPLPLRCLCLPPSPCLRNDVDTTVCVWCTRPDHCILLCDHPYCDAGYHTFCLDPPLTAVPSGDWFCPQCVSMHMASLEERRVDFVKAAYPLATPTFGASLPLLHDVSLPLTMARSMPPHRRL